MKLRKDKQLDHNLDKPKIIKLVSGGTKIKPIGLHSLFFLEAIGRLLGCQSHICHGPKPQQVKTRVSLLQGSVVPAGPGSSQAHKASQEPITTNTWPLPMLNRHRASRSLSDPAQVPAHYDGAGFFAKPLNEEHFLLGAWSK